MKARFALVAALLGLAAALLRADPVPVSASSTPAPAPALTSSAPLALPAPASAVASPTALAPSPALAASIPVAALTLPSPDPQVGQSEAAVYSLLGKPMGRITLPDQGLVLMYGRGDVTIHDGLVTAVKLLDPAAYAAKNAQQAAAVADAIKRTARLNALRKEFLSDPGYLSLPISDRLTALDHFDQEYPGTGIRSDYDALMAVYQAELAAQNELADLQKRLTEAEQQAASAQQEVADAQQQAAAAEQEAANAQAAAAQQNNQTGGYINTAVVASNGYNVYYVGNPYGNVRWGSLRGNGNSRVVGSNGSVPAPGVSHASSN